MGRDEEMVVLEAAEKLDEEKDKSQSDIASAIAMVKEGETEKRKFMIKYARAELVLVFAANMKKSVNKKVLLEELARQMAKYPEKINDFQPSTASTTEGVVRASTTLFRSLVEARTSSRFLLPLPSQWPM